VLLFWACISEPKVDGVSVFLRNTLPESKYAKIVRIDDATFDLWYLTDQPRCLDGSPAGQNNRNCPAPQVPQQDCE
jgi:hypothetical protein